MAHTNARRHSLPFMALALILVAGCTTLPNGRGWGEDATLSPSRGRLAWAATRAARDPGTWIPTLGAATIALARADRRFSDWARDHHPLFGDKNNATHTSDLLRDLTDVTFFTTALMMPSGPPDEAWENKSRGVGVEAMAVITTITVTNTLKYVVHKRQPTGGHESFVSNHATEPFAHAALTRRNLQHLDLAPSAKTTINGVSYLMATGSAWARVEMGLHYPSDQLAGAAIGNFIALFVHDAFLGIDQSIAVIPFPEPTLALRWRW